MPDARPPLVPILSATHSVDINTMFYVMNHAKHGTPTLALSQTVIDRFTSQGSNGKITVMYEESMDLKPYGSVRSSAFEIITINGKMWPKEDIAREIKNHFPHCLLTFEKKSSVTTSPARPLTSPTKKPMNTSAGALMPHHIDFILEEIKIAIEEREKKISVLMKTGVTREEAVEKIAKITLLLDFDDTLVFDIATRGAKKPVCNAHMIDFLTKIFTLFGAENFEMHIVTARFPDDSMTHLGSHSHLVTGLMTFFDEVKTGVPTSQHASIKVNRHHTHHLQGMKYTFFCDAKTGTTLGHLQYTDTEKRSKRFNHNYSLKLTAMHAELTKRHNTKVIIHEEMNYQKTLNKGKLIDDLFFQQDRFAIFFDDQSINIEEAQASHLAKSGQLISVSVASSKPTPIPAIQKFSQAISKARMEMEGMPSPRGHKPATPLVGAPHSPALFTPRQQSGSNPPTPPNPLNHFNHGKLGR